MRDFMAEDEGQFGLVVHQRHELAGDIDIAAGDGEGVVDVERADIEQDIFPISHAHFGLTLIKADKLRNLPRPWLFTTPDAEGKYGPTHTDPDIQFWRNWEKAGNKLFLASRVTIGHLELMVRWPDGDMQPTYQAAKDWEATRKPPEGTWTGVST